MARHDPLPCPVEQAAAVARAVAHQRAVRRADPNFAHYTAAALAERILGLPATPGPPTADGWVPVGEVRDHAADERRRVWRHPATGRVRTQPVPWVAPLEPLESTPPAPRGDGAAFDGERLRWRQSGAAGTAGAGSRPGHPGDGFPPSPTDLDRGSAGARGFVVVPPDPPGIDGDGDGVGGEGRGSAGSTVKHRPGPGEEGEPRGPRPDG